jgi:hypothetical protein
VSGPWSLDLGRRSRSRAEAEAEADLRRIDVVEKASTRGRRGSMRRSRRGAGADRCGGRGLNVGLVQIDEEEKDRAGNEERALAAARVSWSNTMLEID